jgi:outer membrane biosynthesis protein TonB
MTADTCGGAGGAFTEIGNGVSAPQALYTPNPEYTEEARQAKYQGTVVLWLIVGADGKPRDIRVSRPQREPKKEEFKRHHRCRANDEFVRLAPEWRTLFASS